MQFTTIDVNRLTHIWDTVLYFIQLILNNFYFFRVEQKKWTPDECVASVSVMYEAMELVETEGERVGERLR